MGQHKTWTKLIGSWRKVPANRDLTLGIDAYIIVKGYSNEGPHIAEGYIPGEHQEGGNPKQDRVTESLYAGIKSCRANDLK